MLMSRHHPFRWLVVLVLAAGLPALSQAPASEGPAEHFLLPAAAGQPVLAGLIAKVAPITPDAAQAAAVPDLTPEQLGDSLEARQRYEAAIGAYAKDPHPSAAVWNKMGIAYQMMFNLRDATRCYKESLRIDAKNSMVLNNLATVYASLKNYSAAEHMYHKALKIEPDSPLILKNLGTDLLVQHKYSKGWKAYEEAMKLDPAIFEDHDSPTVSNPTSVRERGAMNYFMARGCVRMGQTECALQYLRMALNEGYTTAKKVSEDADFASLRDNPAFKQLVAEQQQQPQQHP